MASKAVTERGESELSIFDFKTIWSEFQKRSQTTTEQGKAKLSNSILKPHLQSSRSPVRRLLSKAKPSKIATEKGEAELRLLDSKTT